jgi:CobN/magnesium chelatase
MRRAAFPLAPCPIRTSNTQFAIAASRRWRALHAVRMTTIVAGVLAITLSTASAQVSQTPRIVLVGGPDPLWPQIVHEYELRYPSNAAAWEVFTSQSGRADLVFAYYPTQEQLRGTLALSATRWLGFPTEFVAAAWKRPVDDEASARASAYLDEGGVENGVRLLAYMFSLVRPGAPVPEPPVKGPQAGIYHPDAVSVFSDYDTYRDWWQNAKGVTRTDPDAKPSAVAVVVLQHIAART